jgi:hypothetical protein
MTTGRPTKQTPEIQNKLEQAFALGATVAGACIYAGIAQSSYYAWAQRDADFSERMKALKQRPVLKALQTVVDDLENPATAKWYLEKRHPDFKPKQEVDIAAKPVLEQTRPEHTLEEATRIYEANLQQLKQVA